jgi:hypothetical protein
VHQRVKHALNCPRPMLFSPRIQPMIQTLRHGALPSGHATEAFAVATVMTHLLAEADAAAANRDPAPFETRAAEAALAMTQHYRLAARIAINRTVSGLHFAVDSAAGAVFGTTLGDYLVARCKRWDQTPYRRFDGTLYHEPDETDARVLVGADFQTRTAGLLLREGRAPGTQAGVVEGRTAAMHPEGRHLPAIWELAKLEMIERWGIVDRDRRIDLAGRRAE